MSIYEALSLGMSALVIVVSGVALFSDIPLKRLQRQQMIRENEARERAEIRLHLLLRSGGGKLVIENAGAGEARQVDVELDFGGRDAPVALSMLKNQLRTDLGPGQRIEVPALPMMPSASSFKAQVRWMDQRERPQQCAQTVHAQWA